MVILGNSNVDKRHNFIHVDWNESWNNRLKYKIWMLYCMILAQEITNIDKTNWKSLKYYVSFGIKYALFSKIHEYDTKGNLGIKKSPPTQLLVWSIFQIWEKTWTSNYFDSHLQPSVVSFIFIILRRILF